MTRARRARQTTPMTDAVIDPLHGGLSPAGQQVNRPLAARELDAVRTSVQRGRPFGEAAWTRGTAERLDLLDSLNPRGRPPRFPKAAGREETL